ncbi:MAG: hypothetical protein ACI4PK_03350 [Oscillospiraceae bacterium]
MVVLWGNFLKNKRFWGNLVYLIFCILIMLDDPNCYKIILLLVIIFESPLPKLADYFRADPQQKPLPPNKGECDYQDGKLVFKED